MGPIENDNARGRAGEVGKAGATGQTHSSSTALPRNPARLPAYARELAELRRQGQRPAGETVIVRLDSWPPKWHIGADFEDGYRCAVICDAILESAASKRQVDCKY